MKLVRASLALPLIALLSLAAPAAALDNWEPVVKDRERQVEIDRSTVIQSDNGAKVAWARIVLSPERAAAEGYAAVKALNRFDCYNRSFFTVKRVYLDSRHLVLREEGVLDQSPMLAARNSVDERLWQEVCRPPSVADLHKVAQHAAASAAAVAEQPKPESRPVSLARAAAPSDATLPANISRDTGRGREAREPALRDGSGGRESGRDTNGSGGAAYVAARTAGAAQPTTMPRTAGSPRSTVTPATVKSNKPTGEPGATDAIAAFAEFIPESASSASTTRATSSPATGASGVSPLPAAASSHTQRTGGRSPSTSIVGAAVTAEQWSYDGDTGPEHWGRLRPEWKLCVDGKQQSPIDVAGGIAVDLEPPRFDYRPTRFRITDTGRTLKVDVGAGMGVEIRGQRYELEHLQFHRPSVERVGGQASAMTVHFHHRAADGRIAIVAVLLERGEMPHPLVQTLWNSLPLERGGHYEPPSATIDPATLIPADPSHYLYLGSLVTPPCTEGVTWVVMKSALTLSDDQLAIFARLYPRNGRPLQPRNGRIVLESR